MVLTSVVFLFCVRHILYRILLGALNFSKMDLNLRRCRLRDGSINFLYCLLSIVGLEILYKITQNNIHQFIQSLIGLEVFQANPPGTLAMFVKTFSFPRCLPGCNKLHTSPTRSFSSRINNKYADTAS